MLTPKEYRAVVGYFGLRDAPEYSVYLQAVLKGERLVFNPGLVLTVNGLIDVEPDSISRDHFNRREIQQGMAVGFTRMLRARLEIGFEARAWLRYVGRRPDVYEALAAILVEEKA